MGHRVQGTARPSAQVSLASTAEDALNLHSPVLRDAVNALSVGPRSNLPYTLTIQALFVCPASPATIKTLVDAVNEYSVELCFTAAGNHLCQQLLEKAELHERLEFLKPITSAGLLLPTM